MKHCLFVCDYVNMTVFQFICGEIHNLLSTQKGDRRDDTCVNMSELLLKWKEILRKKKL